LLILASGKEGWIAEKSVLWNILSENFYLSRIFVVVDYWVSLCILGWPQTHDLHVSAFQVLGLQLYATTPNSKTYC
jgi:hypothetical protein